MDIDITRVIWDYRLEVAKNCAILGCYVASGGNSLPTFRDNLSVPFSGSLTPEDGTDRFSGNVSKELPLLAA